MQGTPHKIYNQRKRSTGKKKETRSMTFSKVINMESGILNLFLLYSILINVYEARIQKRTSDMTQILTC